VTLVNELLTDAGMSMDSFMIKVLGDRIDEIERIDRLTAIAETRRNVALREIDRRRAVLGQTLRRSVQEIEDDEFADGKLVPATASLRKKRRVTSERKIRASRAKRAG